MKILIINYYLNWRLKEDYQIEGKTIKAFNVKIRFLIKFLIKEVLEETR